MFYRKQNSKIKKKMESNVSSRNTKNQILKAYDELLKKVEAGKTEEPKKVQELQKKETLVKNAEQLGHETIVKGISDLKVGLSSSLDQLGEKFVLEFKKFKDLQEAIKAEKNNLEDLYQLSANTDSLSVMLLAQKEKREQFEMEIATRKAESDEKIKTEKERFENEMAVRKAEWKKEQEDFQQKLKEETEQTKKNRKRDEEEYQYTLKTTRKKEADLYEEKKIKLEKELTEEKASFEKDFAERESNIKQAEAELAELRSKNKAFPAEQEKAIQAAIKATTENLETSFRFEKELKEKETSGELKLKDQIIETLKSKIKDLETSQKEFSQKAVAAETSVKDIAIKAIESSSKPYFIEKPKENLAKE